VRRRAGIAASGHRAITAIARVVALTLLAARVAVAQGVPRLAIGLATSGSDSDAAVVVRPNVAAIDVIANGQVRDLLRNGFPARLRFHVELWRKGGLFDALEGSTEWQVIARYDPLSHRYRAARIINNGVTVLGDVDRAPSLDSTIALPFAAPLVPRTRRDHYYYTGTLDVEMISLSDLDEVERWLRGELSPAVRGQRNPGGVIGRGLRSAFLNLIGAERRHYEARSKIFKPS
jgi:hypothetical protein